MTLPLWLTQLTWMWLSQGEQPVLPSWVYSFIPCRKLQTAIKWKTSILLVGSQQIQLFLRCAWKCIFYERLNPLVSKQQALSALVSPKIWKCELVNGFIGHLAAFRIFYSVYWVFYFHIGHLSSLQEPAWWWKRNIPSISRFSWHLSSC